MDARVGGELITSTHLPLIVTVKIAMQQPPPPPQPRPALRTSRVSKEEIHDFVNAVADKLLTKKPGSEKFADSLRALNTTVFDTGTDVVGQKGKRTPTKYSKKDTRTGRLRQQLVALDMAGALLQTQSQAARHWPLFEHHFQPKLPAEIDVELNDARNDSDREQKRAEVKALASRIRGEIERVEEKLRRENNSGVSFREAYRPFMQARKSAAIDHVTLRDSVTAEITQLTSKQEVQNHLLKALNAKFAAGARFKLKAAPTRDSDVEKLVNELVHPYVEELTAVSTIPQRQQINKILLSQKENVKPAIYDGLLQPILESELQEELAAVETKTAAGADGINKWWWKQLLAHEDIKASVLAQLNLYLARREMPETEAIISFIVKKPELGNEFSNLRPVTLQHAIVKIMTGILARRLARVITDHKVLNESQQGFIPDGSCQTCCATLVNAFEHAENLNQPIYAVAYDLSAAYDNIQWPILAWAMRRMHIPAPFIRLILSLLTKTTTRVQTAHGVSEECIQLEKGVPQGDPIAPILFDIAIDALFDILNAATEGWEFEAEDGQGWRKVALRASAYADDITTFNKSMKGTRNARYRGAVLPEIGHPTEHGQDRVLGLRGTVTGSPDPGGAVEPELRPH